jgi:DNA invertase Pin-like site-specific DNA recombinase
MERKLIAYYRVSTKAQGDSGLGLEGQTAAVEGYGQAIGGTILRTYQEVESGKRADRPELAKALADAKRSKATLVIAKLDRLARNVAFLANLMESGVDFVACDNPQANRLTIHILAAVAENEAVMISQRTKAALAAYKARGGILGAARPDCRKLSADASVKGRQAASRAIRAKAKAAYEDLAPMIVELKAAGRSLRDIAGVLNGEGHTTRRGMPWNPMQVSRILERVVTYFRFTVDSIPMIRQ